MHEVRRRTVQLDVGDNSFACITQQRLTSKRAIAFILAKFESLCAFFNIINREMDAETSFTTSSSHGYLGFFIFSIGSLYLLSVLWVAYGSSLRSIPGPAIAKFTPLWLFYKAAQFRSTTDYRGWHERYGPMVRISPNKVSCADPAMIPVIYKIGSKFQKVCAGELRRCIF